MDFLWSSKKNTLALANFPSIRLGKGPLDSVHGRALVSPSPDMQRAAAGKTGIVNQVKASLSLPFFFFWSVSFKCSSVRHGLCWHQFLWTARILWILPPSYPIPVSLFFWDSLQLCTKFALSASGRVREKYLSISVEGSDYGLGIHGMIPLLATMSWHH